MENTHNFIVPSVNLIGVGAIKDLPTQLLKYKLRKVLIVTDKNMVNLGYVNTIETILKSLFISYDIFDGVLHPNPTISFVEQGLKYFHKGFGIFRRRYSFVISIGGGTNHDCAKAIALVATNGGSITDYEGYNKLQKAPIPLIAINTTAGGASEVSNFAIITDESRKVKMTIGDAKMIPFISVNDPIFMNSMPKDVTATSGIDIVSHAIEAYISTETSPITDSLALGALRLAFTYLKRVYDNGNDLEAREKIMFANIKAAMAFNSAGLGYVHAIAHQIGPRYAQIHGACNAVLLPYVLEFNSNEVNDERMLNMAEAIGAKASDKSEALEKIKSAIQGLTANIGLPIDLRKLSVEEKDFEEISINALEDICAFTNPKKGTVDDLIGILKKAY